jgi:hypothetical protein
MLSVLLQGAAACFYDVFKVYHRNIIFARRNLNLIMNSNFYIPMG